MTTAASRPIAALDRGVDWVLDEILHTLVTLTVAAVLGVILGAGFGVILATNATPTPATTLTVTAIRTLSTGPGAEAVPASSPAATPVLLAGDWVVGDTVTAYPEPRTGSTPTYTTIDPNAPAVVISYAAATGMVLGAVALILGIAAYCGIRADWTQRTWTRLAHPRRTRSERILTAALSN